jgi:hypothetical protein
MPTIGVDAQVIIDGNGYFIEPHTYVMHRARIRRSTIVKGGGERYVDLGPGKREWHMTLLCLNQLNDYPGAQLGLNGRQLREQARASYEKYPGGIPSTSTLLFTDIDGTNYNVHFDNWSESVVDVRTQLVAPSYHVAIVLVEA